MSNGALGDIVWFPELGQLDQGLTAQAEVTRNAW
jgi:hypothetical protein